MTSLTFGRLTVLSRASTAPDARLRWLCRCLCGELTSVRHDHLRSGRSRSCGCLRTEATTRRNQERTTTGGQQRRDVSVRGEIYTALAARAARDGTTMAAVIEQAIKAGGGV